MILGQISYGKVDVSLALNGAIGDLVAIIFGGVGGALLIVAVPLIDKLKVDDVVGAIYAHLVAGIWRTLCVGIFEPGKILTQLICIVYIGLFVSITSGIVWYVLNATLGIRVDEEDVGLGLDKGECGMEAYPEFGVSHALYTHAL